MVIIAIFRSSWQMQKAVGEVNEIVEALEMYEIFK